MAAEPTEAERQAAEQKLASMSAEFKSVSGLTDYSKRTEEEQAKVNEGLQALEEAKVAPMPSKGRMIQFLTVANWEVAAAVQNYKDMLQWRQELKIDHIMDQWQSSEERKLFHMLIPSRITGFDKEGLPVVIEKTGRTHPGAIAALDEKQFEHMHLCTMEEIDRTIEQARAKTGQDIVTHTQILDLGGLTLSHSSVLTFLQKAVVFDRKYYPERMERVLIVNAPWIVPGLWEMVRLFLHESLQSKIAVLGWNYKEELKKYVDPENLPAEYGGTGPDIPVASSEEMADYTRKDAQGLSLKQQYIYASSSFDKSVEVPAGHQVVWSFEVVDGYDVDFSAEATGTAALALHAKSRCITHKGAYTATEDLTIKFVWDNSFSWVNGKYLNWHVSVKTPEQLAAE